MVDLIQRRDNYRAIEEYRRRPLIVYATSTRPNVQAAMAGDAVREFIDQIDAVPKDGRKVDVLLHSTGGDALTADRKSTRLNSSHLGISYAVFCLKKKT